MNIIKLNATEWKTWHDVYDAILPAIGAPIWHGRNANALLGSMIWEDINDVKPPYTLQISSTAKLPAEIADTLERINQCLQDSCAEFRIKKGYDAGVTIQLIP